MKQKIYRWFFYVLGLLLLAVGLTLNTKTDLGTSSIISVPYVISQIWDLNFGNTTYAAYSVFVVIQVIIIFLTAKNYDKKQQRIRVMQAVLQLPFSLAFTWVMNLVSVTVPVLQEGFPDSFLGSFAGRLSVLLLAVTLAGVGSALSLNMRLVPNPGDGIVRGLAEFTGKSVGFTKNCFDLTCCCISLITGFVFTGGIVGIGLGTLVAALGTGRVVALANRLFSDKICELSGLEPDITAKR